MKASYLAQDRPDLSETVRLLAQSMSCPREADMVETKRLGRYLHGRKRAWLEFPLGWPSAGVQSQRPPSGKLHVHVDADWAGDPLSRKSVSGFAAIRGGCLIKHNSLTQTAVGLSSCESEYYALCRGRRQH